ncbi:hypothetical protein LRB11_16590, partial [Ectothiorhodospira haloalkaliphila]|uniref:hypothetical protein n=1 Tax=Ectothiorhodospira haloalkaliphila TaxID=421628 RepID=UPI001EE9A339
EADAVATEYSVQATSAQFATAKAFKLTIPAAEEGEDPTVIDIDDLDVSGGASLATALNGNSDFSDAGLEATFSASTGTLTVSDAAGRTLEGVELIGAAQPSNAEVELLESRLVNTGIVRLSIDGEEIELRGIEGDSGTDIAASIKGKLHAIEDADGEKPYANMTVEFDEAASVLTIEDDERREISDVSLQRNTDSKVEISLGEDNLDDVEQLEITLDGETKLVDVSDLDTPGSDNSDWTELADLVSQKFFGEDAGKTGLSAAVTVGDEETPAVITITDTWGRDFGATKLLGEGEEPVPSETVIGPLSADEVGQFSVTIGSGSNAVVIEKASIDAANPDELVTQINELLSDADLGGADVDGGAFAVKEGDGIKIVNNAGTGISNIYVGTALDADDASSVEISGLTDVLAGNVASFEIKIGGQTYTITDADQDGLPAGEVDFSAVSDIAELQSKLQEALRAQETVSGREDITVSHEADTQTIVITDKAGRELSGVAMAGAEDAGQASSAVVSGINDDAVNLDLGYIEIKYNDSENDEKTVTLNLGDNVVEDAEGNAEVTGASSEAEQQVDTVTLSGTFAEGDTVTVTFDGTEYTYEVAEGDIDGLGDNQDTWDSILGNLGNAEDEDGMSLADATSAADVTYDGGDGTFTANTTGEALPSIAVVATIAGDGNVEISTTTPNEVGAAQVTTITFGSVAPAAGYVYTVAIEDDESYTYTAVDGDGWAEVLSGLEAAIDDDFTVATDAAARTLTLTATDVGAAGAFSVSEATVIDTNVVAGIATLADLENALNAALVGEFTVQAFSDDETLVITADNGNELTSVAFKTGPTGPSVVDGVEIIDAIEGEDGVALDIGAIGEIENATSGEAIFGVEATVTEEGAVEGLNAPQLGNDGVVTDAEETPVTIIDIEYSAGAEGAPVGDGI